jgi:hypothetical protein
MRTPLWVAAIAGAALALGATGVASAIDWTDGTETDQGSVISVEGAPFRGLVWGRYPVCGLRWRIRNRRLPRSRSQRSGTVFDAALPAPPVLPLHATAGEPVTGAIATFSDPGGDPAD